MRNLTILFLALAASAIIPFILNFSSKLKGVDEFNESEQVSIAAYIELSKSLESVRAPRDNIFKNLIDYISPSRSVFSNEQLLCIGIGRSLIFTLDDPPELFAPPAIGNIVSYLRRIGYDAISATDCVYRVGGPKILWISSRSISRPALLISISSLNKQPADGAYSVSGFLSYGMMGGGCICWRFIIARADTGYEVVAGSKTCSIWS